MRRTARALLVSIPLAHIQVGAQKLRSARRRISKSTFMSKKSTADDDGSAYDSNEDARKLTAATGATVQGVDASRRPDHLCVTHYNGQHLGCTRNVDWHMHVAIAHQSCAVDTSACTLERDCTVRFEDYTSGAGDLMTRWHLSAATCTEDGLSCRHETKELSQERSWMQNPPSADNTNLLLTQCRAALDLAKDALSRVGARATVVQLGATANTIGPISRYLGSQRYEVGVCSPVAENFYLRYEKRDCIAKYATQYMTIDLESTKLKCLDQTGSGCQGFTADYMGSTFSSPTSIRLHQPDAPVPGSTSWDADCRTEVAGFDVYAQAHEVCPCFRSFSTYNATSGPSAADAPQRCGPRFQHRVCPEAAHPYCDDNAGVCAAEAPSGVVSIGKASRPYDADQFTSNPCNKLSDIPVEKGAQILTYGKCGIYNKFTEWTTVATSASKPTDAGLRQPEPAFYERGLPESQCAGDLPACSDSCASAHNGVCEDGLPTHPTDSNAARTKLTSSAHPANLQTGTSSVLLREGVAKCPIGTDCSDCGVRQGGWRRLLHSQLEGHPLLDPLTPIKTAGDIEKALLNVFAGPTAATRIAALQAEMSGTRRYPTLTALKGTHESLPNDFGVTKTTGLVAAGVPMNARVRFCAVPQLRSGDFAALTEAQRETFYSQYYRDATHCVESLSVRDLYNALVRGRAWNVGQIRNTADASPGGLPTRAECTTANISLGHNQDSCLTGNPDYAITQAPQDEDASASGLPPTSVLADPLFAFNATSDQGRPFVFQLRRSPRFDPSKRDSVQPPDSHLRADDSLLDYFSFDTVYTSELAVDVTPTVAKGSRRAVRGIYVSDPSAALLDLLQVPDQISPASLTSASRAALEAHATAATSLKKLSLYFKSDDTSLTASWGAQPQLYNQAYSPFNHGQSPKLTDQASAPGIELRGVAMDVSCTQPEFAVVKSFELVMRLELFGLKPPPGVTSPQYYDPTDVTSPTRVLVQAMRDVVLAFICEEGRGLGVGAASYMRGGRLSGVYNNAANDLTAPGTFQSDNIDYYTACAQFTSGSSLRVPDYAAASSAWSKSSTEFFQLRSLDEWTLPGDAGTPRSRRAQTVEAGPADDTAASKHIAFTSTERIWSDAVVERDSSREEAARRLTAGTWTNMISKLNENVGMCPFGGQRTRFPVSTCSELVQFPARIQFDLRIPYWDSTQLAEVHANLQRAHAALTASANTTLHLRNRVYARAQQIYKGANGGATLEQHLTFVPEVVDFSIEKGLVDAGSDASLAWPASTLSLRLVVPIITAAGDPYGAAAIVLGTAIRKGMERVFCGKVQAASSFYTALQNDTAILDVPSPIGGGTPLPAFGGVSSLAERACLGSRGRDWTAQHLIVLDNDVPLVQRLAMQNNGTMPLFIQSVFRLRQEKLLLVSRRELEESTSTAVNNNENNVQQSRTGSADWVSSNDPTADFTRKSFPHYDQGEVVLGKMNDVQQRELQISKTAFRAMLRNVAATEVKEAIDSQVASTFTAYSSMSTSIAGRADWLSGFQSSWNVTSAVTQIQYPTSPPPNITTTTTTTFPRVEADSSAAAASAPNSVLIVGLVALIVMFVFIIGMAAVVKCTDHGQEKSAEHLETIKAIAERRGDTIETGKSTKRISRTRKSQYTPYRFAEGEALQAMIGDIKSNHSGDSNSRDPTRKLPGGGDKSLADARELESPPGGPGDDRRLENLRESLRDKEENRRQSLLENRRKSMGNGRLSTSSKSRPSSLPSSLQRKSQSRRSSREKDPSLSSRRSRREESPEAQIININLDGMQIQGDAETLAKLDIKDPAGGEAKNILEILGTAGVKNRVSLKSGGAVPPLKLGSLKKKPERDGTPPST
ncbi:unnamed protein product [Amoebophrya sp. A25]|nr:unnamed protein product [Amoebophrya sp. A25]|eukprot:GSA25T00020033001.1